MAETPAIAQAPARPAFNPWIVAMTVTLATFMEVLDSTITNVSLPHIAGTLGANCGGEHLGHHQLPRLECGCAAHERLACQT